MSQTHYQWLLPTKLTKRKDLYHGPEALRSSGNQVANQVEIQSLE